MSETPEALKLPVQAHDKGRMRIYDEIGRVHRQIVEARLRAKMANQPMPLDPSLILHCEQAVAFLAEEVLKLGMLVETEMSVRKSVEGED